MKGRNSVLAILLTLVVLNYMDRLALGILQEDIKRDLALSDTQLGLLTGIAFALFYSVMALPIARWADRGNRVTIIAGTAALWSCFVALCGMAGSFVQLLSVRVGVAVGEAGCVPPALSLIADYFDRAERPRALAIYGLGGPLSSLISFALAGWLNELYGWRNTFIIMAVPGLIFALVAWFGLSEPRQSKEYKATAKSSPSVREVVALLWGSRTFRRLLLCVSVLFFFLYGTLQWYPSYLIRTHGLGTAEVGMWLALVIGGSSIVGALIGGEAATRLASRQEDRQLKMIAVGFMLTAVFAVPMYLTGSLTLFLVFLGLAFLTQNIANGPLFATIQSVVPERMRATAFAVIYLFANLIGMGFGPLAVGALSDTFEPTAGAQSLRYALLLITPGYLVVAAFAYAASKSVLSDMGDLAEADQAK